MPRRDEKDSLTLTQEQLGLHYFNRYLESFKGSQSWLAKVSYMEPSVISMFSRGERSIRLDHAIMFELATNRELLAELIVPQFAEAIAKFRSMK